MTDKSVRESLRSQYELSDELLKGVTSVDMEDDVVTKVSECVRACVINKYFLSE